MDKVLTVHFKLLKLLGATYIFGKNSICRDHISWVKMHFKDYILMRPSKIWLFEQLTRYANAGTLCTKGSS